MNAKGALIAVLLAGGLALWLLGDDEQPTPPADSSAPPEARQAYRVPPRRPQAPEPRFDYPMPAPPQPFAGTSQFPPFGAPPVDPYVTGGWAGGRSDAYRFRPLNDAERRRHGIAETPPLRSAAPRTATRDFPDRSWSQGDYRFRPFSPGDGGSGRYRGYTPDYPWETEPDYAERWEQPAEVAPPPTGQPPWQAPSRLMLPSLDWPSDRTLTAR
jgi:hypothetical protein